MGRKSKYSLAEKIQAVLDYKSGKKSISEISKTLGMSKGHAESGYTVRRWISFYDKYGEDGFLPKNKNKIYPKEFKEKVVKEYLDGIGSFESLSLKYDIPSKETLRIWVISYNSHEELKDYNPKGDVYMASARRKTTIEERIEIVKYALDNNNDYKGAADKFLVPYANVYKWVKMYNEQGEEGLKFHRGRPKNSITELTELEKKDLEIAKLKLELEKHKRAEEILKKNLEIRKQLFKDSHK